MCSGSKNIAVYACDCSSEALVRTKENIDLAIASADNFHSFCCDFSKSKFPNWVACDHCRDNFKLKKDRYHSGFGPCPPIHDIHPCKLHIDLSYSLIHALLILYCRMLLHVTGGSEDIHGNYKCSLNEHCIGGVDFVTLVCESLGHLVKEQIMRLIPFVQWILIWWSSDDGICFNIVTKDRC